MDLTFKGGGGAGTGGGSTMQRMFLNVQQTTPDPQLAGVAGRAAPNPVTVSQLHAPPVGSELMRWAATRTSGAATTATPASAAVPTPKVVTQFAMADDVSRQQSKGEIAPALWAALMAECEGRKRVAEAELVAWLGEAAEGQLTKQLAAMLSFQFKRMLRPMELTQLRPRSGSLGGAATVNPVSVDGAVGVVAGAMAVAFPEFDWAPYRELATMVGRILQMPGRAAPTQATRLYNWLMGELQTRGREAREDTSAAGLSLGDTAALLREVQARGRAALAVCQEQQQLGADLRAEMGLDAAPAAAASPGQGGGGAAVKAFAGGGLAASLNAGRALTDPEVKMVMSSFKATFPGKCIHFACTGKCNPKGGSACPHSHDSPPARDAVRGWAAALGFTLP